jgi:tetratricopeptide (TPR) repeat protein
MNDASADQVPDSIPEADTGVPIVVDEAAKLVDKGDHRGAAQALEGAISTLRKTDLQRAAQLFVDAVEGKLSDRKRARRFVEELLAIDPTQVGLLRVASGLALRSADHAVAIEYLSKVAGLLDSAADKAAIWEEMGDVARDAKRTQDAIVHYQAAFRAHRGQVSAIRKAARLYLDEGREELAKQLLDLEVAAATKGGGDVAKDLGEVYLEVAEGLITRPQGHAIARAAALSAQQIDPTRDAASKVLTTLDEFPQKWKEHVRRLRDGALDARDKREAAKKYLSIAQIFREFAPDDTAQMQQNIDKCLLLAPGFRPALKFVEDVHRSGGRVGEFIEYLKKQAAGIRAVDVAVEIWLYIAVLMAEQGASPEELATAFENVRSLDPRNLSAISALTELHLENGRFKEAASVMEDFLAETSDATAKRSTLRTLARLYEVEVGDLGKAAQAIEALRTLGGGPELLLSLVDIYARLNDDVKLASTLELLAKSPAAQKFEGGPLAVLERLYALYEGPLAQPEKAFSAGARLFALAPRDVLERDLIRLADALARTNDLAEAYLASSARSEDASVKREQRLKAARAFVSGGDSRRARAVLTTLLAENPKDKDALDLLDRILEREADPTELVEVLEGRLRSEDDARSRVRLLISLADALDRLRKAGDAIDRLKQVLEIDPSDEDALERLDNLLKTEERWADLAHNLERRLRVALDRSQTGPAVTTMKRRLARLYDDRLDRGSDAARLYLEIYDDEPEDPDVVRALERLLDRGVAQVSIASALQPYYARVEAWRRQVEMIEIRRGAEEDSARRATLARAAADILEEKLRAPREAFEAWANCLLDEPTSSDVVKTLERLSSSTNLEARFAEVLAQAADHLPDGPAKNAMLSRRAALLQGVLGDEGAAIEAHLVVLEKNPSHLPSLDALADLYDARGAWRELADVLARRRQLTPPEEAAKIAGRLGVVLGERLGETAAALEPLRAAVFGSSPLEGGARGDVLRLLAHCLRLQGPSAAAELALVLPLLAEGLAGVDRARVRVELGDLLREQLARPGDAVDAYEAALANDRQSAGALAGLRALLDDESAPVQIRQDAGRTLTTRYESERNVAGRTHVLHVLLQIEEDRAARRRMVNDLTTLLVDENEMPDEALSLLLDHLARDPADSAAHDRADAIATLVGRPRDLVALYERLVVESDAVVARTARERLATLAERIGDLEAAIQAVRGIIALDPTRAESWERLRTLFDRRGDAEGVAECLAQLAALTDGAARMARLLVLADFCFEVLEDDNRGLEALRSCRQLAGDDDNILLRLHTRLRELERFDELVEIIGARAEQASQPGASAALLLEQGQILLEKLHRPREAVASLTRALVVERDGNSTARITDALQSIARRDDDAGLTALDAIVDHHRAQKAWQPLIESLEIAAQKRPAGAERAALFDEVSRLQEDAIRIPQLAFRAACLAFREDPTDERLHRVNVLASATASFQDAATVVEDAAKALAPSDPVRATRLFRSVIDVASRRLDDKAMQVRAAEAILSLDRSDAEALALLEGIHRSSEDEEQLIEVLKRRAEASEDPIERRTALIEMGQILMARGDETMAERCLRRVLHEDASDDNALLLLDELYARTGNSAAHAEILERRIQRAPDGERAEHWVRLGLLRLTRRGDPAGATDAFTSAVAESPAAPVVRQGLEALVSNARAHGVPSVAVAAELLERTVRAQGDWNSVVPVMELRLQSEPSRAGRALFLVEMAQVQELKLQSPLMAFKTMCRAMQEVPDDGSIREEAERLARDTDSLDTLAIIYDDLLEQVSDPSVRVLLNRRMAAIAESVGGDLGEAKSRLQAAVQAGAADLELLQNLTRLTRPSGDPEEHASALLRLATVAAESHENDIAKEAYFELCDVDENRGNLDGAISAAKELLTIDEQDPQARALVERLLSLANRWADLVSHLATFSQNAGTVEQRADTLARLIFVRLERVRDFEGAVSALEELHDLSPTSDAVVTLGARVLNGLRAETGDQAPMWRARIAILLEPRYESQGNFAALVDVLRLRLEVTSDPAVRKSLWHRIVEVCEKKLDQAQQAFFAISRALQEDPGDKITREWAERISVKLGDLETLVGLYEDLIEALPSGDALRVLYATRCGELYEGGIGDPSQAARFYEKAVALLTLERRAEREDVLDRLETLYRRMGDPANLAVTLRRRAENRDPSTESDLARQQLYEAATIQMHGLADYSSAIDTLQKLLRVAPYDLPALRALGEASERLGRWADLAEALERELAAVGNRDPQRSVDARYKLAVVLDSKLDLATDADAHFAAILQAHPDHELTRKYLAERLSQGGAFRADGARFLEESYEATGDFAKAVDILQQRLVEAERRGDRKEARDISVHIADIQETKLRVPDIAFMSLCRAVKNDPQDTQIRDRLLTLARANDVVDELCEVYEDEATAAETTGRSALAAELREQAAKIYADVQGDLNRAITAYEQILEKHPGRVVPLEELTRLYLAARRYEDHEKMVRRRLMFLDEPEDRVPLLMSLATTVADHLDRPGEAIPLAEEVRKLKPAHIEARRLLIALRDDEDSTEILRALLEEELTHCRESSDATHLAQYRRRLAILLSETLGDVEAATPLWEEIRAAEPDDRATFLALESCYERGERWADLRILLEQARAAERDPNRISILEQKLGSLLAEKLGGVDEAIERHLKVLEYDPRNVTSLNALRGLYRSAGKYDELVALLRKMMRFTGDPRDLKGLRFDLAEVVGERLDKRAEAVETGRRILDIEPHSVEELTRLARIFRTNEAWEELADTLERSAALDSGSLKIEKLLELARVHEEKLGRPEGAGPAYRGVLSVDPGNDLAYTKLTAIYEKLLEWQPFVSLKEARLSTRTDHVARRDLLVEIGRVQEEKLAQKDLAFLTACRAYREDFDNDDVAAWLDRLAVETDTVDEVLEVYDDALGHISDERRIIETHIRMAELAAKHLDDVEQAELHFRRALEYDARNHTALDKLIAMFESKERTADAVGYLERKAEIVDDTKEKIEIYRRIARTLDERAQDVEGAVAAYKRILELDGTDRVALRELASVYQRAERWQALISIFEREEDVVGSLEEKLSLRYRAAGIWEQELNNADQAIATYRSILDEQPGHQLALKALERLFTSLDRPADLIDVFEQMVRHAADVSARVRLLNKVASTWEESFENHEKAIAAFDRVLEIDPENVMALRSLERLLRQIGAWERLISALKRHIDLSKDAAEIVKLYIEIGETYYRELGNSAKAEEYYTAALDHDPESRDANSALGQLYERSGNWFNALEKLNNEAQIIGTTPEAVDLYYRIGKINEDMLLDVDSAQSAYERALEIDHTHLPSIQALKEIAHRRSRWDDYLKFLRSEASFTEDDWGKTELHTTAGLFLQEKLSDLDGAVAEFERALAVTYDHLPAVRPFADIAFRNESWDRAEGLLDIIVERLDASEESSELCRQFYRLGYVCEKVGKEAKALKSYQRAYELDATYLPALEGLGTALNKAGRYDDAAKIYHAILIHHRDGLTDAEVVDYYQQLATLNFKLGQNDRAKKNLEKALELDTAHAPSLRLLSDIHLNESRFEEAYETLMQLAPLLGSHDRVEALVEIGRLSRDKLDDAYRAIDAYEDANRQRPNDKTILEAMLSLYRDTRQGPRAIEILEELVRIEPDEKARVRLNNTLGEVYRDEIKNEGRALQYFNAALDLDPTYLRAFEAIERMLSASHNWKGLEDNYIMMLRRIPEDRGGIKMVIWKNLGELYRYKLKNPDGAAAAYTVIHKADPDNVEVLEVLAELLARVPARVDEAIAAYERLFPKAGDRQKPILHALVRLYLGRQMADRTYVTTTVLKALRDLDPDEQKLNAHYARAVPPRARHQLQDKVFDQLVVHELARGPLLEISAALWRGAGTLFTAAPKDLELDKKRVFVQLEFDAPLPSLLVTQLKYVRQVLGAGAFDLYVKRGVADPIAPAPAQRPTLLVGEGNDVFREMPERQLWFIIGRQVAYLHPAFILPRALGAAKFQAVVDAAIRLVDPRYPAQGDAREVQEATKQLTRAGAGLAQLLRAPAMELLKTKKPAPVATYLEGVEHTVSRAAHLLAGDLEVAALVLRQPDPGVTSVPYGTKMRELVNFTISPAHYQLRTQLGIAIPST